MWFRMGHSLQLTQKNILRYLRLRSPLDPIRTIIRYERWSLVSRCINFLTTHRKSSLLSSQQEINHEKNIKCQQWNSSISWKYVSKNSRFYLKTYQEESLGKTQSNRGTKTSISFINRRMICFNLLFLLNIHMIFPIMNSKM